MLHKFQVHSTRISIYACFLAWNWNRRTAPTSSLPLESQDNRMFRPAPLTLMWYVHPMSVEGSMQWRRVNQRNCCQLPWATVPKNTTPQSSPERYLEDTLSKKNCHLHTDGYTLTDGRQPHEDSPLIKCRSPSCFGIPTVVSAIFVISSYQTSTISSSTSYPAKCKM